MLIQLIFLSAVGFFAFQAYAYLKNRRGISVWALFAPLLLLQHSFGAFFAAEQVATWQGRRISSTGEFQFFLGLSVMYFILGSGLYKARPIMARNLPNLYQANQRFATNYLPALGILAMTLLVLLLEIAQRGSLSEAISVFTLQSTPEAYARLRSSAVDVGPLSFLSFLSYSALPFALVYGIVKKEDPRIRAISIFVLVLTAAWSLLTGAKAFVIWFLLLLVLAFWMQRGFRVARPGRVFLVLALPIIIVPFQYMAQYGVSYGDGVGLVVNRLFVEPNRGLILYFEFFPAISDHSLGLGSKLASIFGLIPELPNYLKIPQGFGVMNSVWNVAFIGDAWADFGWAGVVLESALVVAILCWLDWYLAPRFASAEIKALHCVLTLAAAKLAFASLLSTLLGFGLISSLIIFFFCFSQYSANRGRPAADTVPAGR